MEEKQLKELMNEGVEGYNKIVYHYIVNKDFKNAHRYADMKMDMILELELDMEDDDISLVAYTYAMNKDYESSRNCIQVLYDDSEIQVDESHLDLYASMAMALIYLDNGDKEKASQLLKQAASKSPDNNHLGADEVLLEQVKELQSNEEYFKQLDDLLENGLYMDEADKVIYGDLTLEEALKNHKPVSEEPVEDVDIETYEDAEELMKVVNKITEERK